MHWFNFGIALFLTLILQIGSARLFGLGSGQIMPDLLLMVMVIIAFRARREQAPLAGWVLGLVKDLTSQAPLGGYAFGFGLAALLIVYLREYFYGDNPITLMVIAFLSSFLIEQFVLVLCLVKGIFSGRDYGSLTMAITFSSLLTAALTPYGHWVMMRFYRQLGLPRQRKYGR